MSKKVRLWPAVMLVFSLLLAACGTTTPPPSTAQPAPVVPATPDLIKVKISYSAYSAAISPLWIAFEEGLFKKNGLDVELIYIDGGAKSVQALLSNDVHIALASADAVVNAALKGADVEMITGCYDRFFFQLWGKAGITKPADLKGKVIGVAGAGTATEAAVKAALGAAGLKDSDYKLTFVSNAVARLAALEQGVIDAAIISPPDGLRAKKAGAVEIINLTEVDLPGGYCTMNARKSWVDANREAVRRFAKGYVEGIAKAKQDKTAAQAHIAKYTKVTEQDLLDESYRMAIPAVKQAPHPPIDIVKDILNKSADPTAKTAKPETFVDPSFIKELEDSGFIAKLYGK